jgi:hypothetical protein
MMLPVVGTLAAYALLALLLISLNLTSRWRWWIKGGAIVVTAAVFVASYFMIMSLIGWPSPDTLPRRFSLLQTRITEPDKIHNESGTIYMWVQEIDEHQRPIAPPRAYGLPFTPGLLRSAAEGQQRLDKGQEVLGTTIPPTEAAKMQQDPKGRATDLTYGAGGTNGVTGTKQQNGAGAGSAGFEGGQDVTFEEMPPPELPSKPVLPAGSTQGAPAN